MSRVACKIAARSVKLVIVLLMLTAWWEPLYMQANTCIVCTPNRGLEEQTADAPTDAAGSSSEGRQASGQQDQLEAVESLAGEAGSLSRQDAGKASGQQEKRDAAPGAPTDSVSSSGGPDAGQTSGQQEKRDAASGSSTDSVSSSEDAGQAEQRQTNKDPQSDLPAEAIGAAKASKVYTVIATGYYAGVESTGKRPGHPQYGITYSGVRARRGVISTIAADLSIFPLGTLLYIPGYGYGVVADIGSAVKGNVIDLYFQTKEDIYKQWGKRTVDVIVIEEGDGHLDEERLLQLEEMFRNKPSPPSAL